MRPFLRFGDIIKLHLFKAFSHQLFYHLRSHWVWYKTFVHAILYFLNLLCQCILILDPNLSHKSWALLKTWYALQVTNVQLIVTFPFTLQLFDCLLNYRCLNFHFHLFIRIFIVTHITIVWLHFYRYHHLWTHLLI